MQTAPALAHFRTRSRTADGRFRAPGLRPERFRFAGFAGFGPSPPGNVIDGL